MFGFEAAKPRKVTTYGKAPKQQTYSFNPFLQNSPEKPKRETIVYKSKNKGRVAALQDNESTKEGSQILTERSPAGAVDDVWDVPSDKEHLQSTKQAKSQLSKSSVVQRTKSTTTAESGRLKESERKVSNVLGGMTVNNDFMQDIKRKRKRDTRPKTLTQRLEEPSGEKDIYDISSEDEAGMQLRREQNATLHRVPAPLKSKPQPQQRPVNSSAVNLNTSRTRRDSNTPEPRSQRPTPLTARRVVESMDVYDFPEDDRAKSKPNLMMMQSTIPSRKRQITPAIEGHDEGRLIVRRKAKVTPRRNSSDIRDWKSPPRAIDHVNAPNLTNDRKKLVAVSKNVVTNGVTKRKLAKGLSAPASLFSMVREPPSPPTDSSAINTSPASPMTPNMTSEMDVDPAPSTPPNRASASPLHVAGSLTPRQRQLWGQLLNEEPKNNSSDLSLSQLRLSSTVTPIKPAIGFSRSASDLPQSMHSRRPRLIDSLKASSTIAEDDEMDLDKTLELATKAASLEMDKPPQMRSEISFKNTSTKVTYGQGRTYLEEQDESKIWEMLAEIGPAQISPGFGSQSQEAELEDTEMDSQTQLRAAHDLRAAGSQKRLHDELSMFVMDLEQPAHSIAIRRSALRDLADKLMDKNAADCFLESGLDRSFLKSVEKDTDTVFLFLEGVIIFLLLGANPTSSVLDHIFLSKTFTNMLKLLDINSDLSRVIRDRKSNLSKMTQSMILELKDAILESSDWGPTKPRTLTPQVVGLLCVEMLVGQLRANGSASVLLTEATMKQLLDIVQDQIITSEPDLSIVGPALSALQACTAGSSTSTKASSWPRSLTQPFVNTLPSILALTDKSAHLCIQLSLKISVELANNNLATCDVLGTAVVMGLLLQKANDRYSQLLNGGLAGEAFIAALDLTVLTFGLTTNLTEASDSSRLAVNSCQAHLHDSIRLFVRGKKRAEHAESLEDTQTNVICGYLAFTLGNLSRNTILKKEIAKSLPGGDLSMVLDAMQEFIKINQMTDKRDFDGEEGNEVFRTFTRRLQAVVEEVSKLNM